MPRFLRTLLFLILSALPLAAEKPVSPGSGERRNLVVYFAFRDSSCGLEAAVDYVFRELLRPGDQLVIHSPERFYGFSAATLAGPKDELIAKMQSRIRRDVARAANEPREILREMRELVAGIGAMVIGEVSDSTQVSLRNRFMSYGQALANLRQLRPLDRARLEGLAAPFRDQEGENHLVLLVEQENRPVPSRETMKALADPVFAMQANALFFTDNLLPPFDVDALAGFFRQVPVKLHFLYVKTKGEFATGETFEDSSDLYAAFSRIAALTGGVCDTGSEPLAGLQALRKVLNATF